MTPPLAVLLKAPRLGMVKTRLAAEIGERHALRLYRVLAARTLTAVRAAGLEAIIWFAPAGRSHRDGVLAGRCLGAAAPSRPAISAPGWPQPPTRCRGDIRGWRSAPIVPGSPPPLLREACTQLERLGLVIGPSDDGGYYLIGGRTPLPDIFTGMPWGTDRVLRGNARPAHANQRPLARAPALCATSTPPTTRAPKDS